MTPISGIAETSLYVADIVRSRDFYAALFRFPEIHREENRLIAMGIAFRQVLLLFSKEGSTHATDTPGGRIPPHDGSGPLHVAFAIEHGDIEFWRVRLSQNQITIESEVDCPKGGHSIYFRDPDQHLLELITPGCWSVG